MTTFSTRQSPYPIREEFLSRISFRAFDEKVRLTEDQLQTIFEAARWAPSSFNNQPWRFIYARRGEKEWETLFNALVDFNKSWCKHADTLVVVLTRNNFEKNNKPSMTAKFDTGAAWMSLALQAHADGFMAHGMEGFDAEALKKNLNIPDTYSIDCMVAIGKYGKEEELPKELQEKEKPTLRKPLSEIISKGTFNFT
jgi:nitroreductase